MIDDGGHSGHRATLGCPMSKLALAALLVALPSAALAHVNWFVDPHEAGAHSAIAFTDPIFLVWTVLAAAMVASSVWLDGRLPVLRIADTKTRHDFIEILRVFTGMSFLLTAYEGALLAPHFAVEGGFATALLFLQAIIGILLIANRWVAAAAGMMLALHAGLLVKFGLLSALEYAIFVGIALFLLFNKAPLAWRDHLKPYSVAALRIGVGVALVALAYGEKLAPAALGVSFVSTYQWNFMEALGVGFFNDRLFVLSAGMVEAAMGIMLILGTTVRLAVLALSVMMALSNVVFILQGNTEAALVEFVGHMPIIGAALVLLLLGYGQRLKVTAMLPQRAAAVPGE